jgi:biotin transporter BioY
VFELIAGFIEAISSYIIGRFQPKRKTAFQLSALLASFLCGFIFFVAYGFYELMFPAPNPKGNMWWFLFFLSISIAISAYIIIIIDYLIKRRAVREKIQRST